MLLKQRSNRKSSMKRIPSLRAQLLPLHSKQQAPPQSRSYFSDTSTSHARTTSSWTTTYPTLTAFWRSSWVFLLAFLLGGMPGIRGPLP